MCVAGLIIRMSASMGIDAIYELTDRKIDDKTFEEIKAFIKSYNEIEDIISLRIRRSGYLLF